jgi:D-galactarolactone isomerase
MSAGAAAGFFNGGTRNAAAQQVKWSSGTEAPKLKAPANSCDCHNHIYDAKYPVDLGSTLRPGDAFVEDYRAFQKRIGTSRNVVVTSSTYGTDNRVSLDAGAAFGATARAAVVVDDTVTDAELKRMHSQGARGIRFQSGAGRSNDAGDGRAALQLGDRARVAHSDQRTGRQDHGDHADPRAGPVPNRVRPSRPHPRARGDQPSAVRPDPGIARQGPDLGQIVRRSCRHTVGPPTYANSTAVAQAYVKAPPERLVLGSDWPHPGERESKPDDAVLFDLLLAGGARRGSAPSHPGREPGDLLRLSEERLRALRFARAPARYRFLSGAAVAILCGLNGCSTTNAVKPHSGSAPQTEVIYVISGGWHTELGLPLEAITGPLAALKPEFPSARYLVFGWVHTTITWPKIRASEMCSGRSLPGLRSCSSFRSKFSPEAFFGASNVFPLPASQDGIQSLATFLWDYLTVDKEGPLRRIGTGPYPQSVFFASTGAYNLGHTCDIWTGEALRAAVLPVTAAGVVFAGQVLDQLRPILAGSNS